LSELRLDRLRDQWVITATHRMARTHLPSAAECPLCPTRPGGPSTEVPAAAYELVVFENRFPSLRTPAAAPALEDREAFPVRPAEGFCEVVLYTDDHRATLTEQPVERFERLIRVWTHRYQALAARPEVAYVFIFENRGEEVGVTLHHPHGQIYAYPFIPPIPALEIAQASRYHQATGRSLFTDVLADEIRDGARVVAGHGEVWTLVPFAARWSYETVVAPARCVAHLGELTDSERWDLAAALKDLLTRYDHLFARPMPYVMSVHQAPTDGTPGPHHLHFEFAPRLRAAGRLKFQAGSESGVDVWINDSHPEEKADELRRARGYHP